MALKVVRRLRVLKQVAVPHLVCPTTLNACLKQHVCAPAVTLSQDFRPSLSAKEGNHRRTRRLSTTTREPLFLVAGSIRLPRDASRGGALTSLLHGLSADEKRAFKGLLFSCMTSQQVLHLVHLTPHLTNAGAVAVLHRLADLEQNGGRGLKEPEVLLSDPGLNRICLRLQQEAGELEDEVVVRALLGCTRLYLDPHSHLVTRLMSETQVRLNTGHLSIETLSNLVQALFALNGPNCCILEQAVCQIQNKDPAQWNPSELTSVYKMLASGLGLGGRYQELLNEINARALRLASKMDRVTVSETLGALVMLGQKQALPLVIALCKQAVRHVPNFADTELSVVLSALMHYGHSDHFLVEALERHVPKIAFTAHPETVTRVMQYFGRRRIFSPPVFDAVAESFVYRADEYTTEQMSRQIVALGAVGYIPQEAGRLFRKVESVLNARFSQFHPRTLLALLHACTLLQRFPLNFVSKVFSPFFLQELQDGSVMDQAVLAQLTQLYMTMKLECPFYRGPQFLPKLRVKSFLAPGSSLESLVDPQLYNGVKSGLVDLLGGRTYFASKVLTPYCYTLDVEIKLDENGYVLPATHVEEIYKRIALCIDGPKRFAANARHLLGKEAIKQRHLKILGYEIVQIPYFEFEKLKDKANIVEYLHKKIFPHTYRLSW
ncbi:FAST kinase domain-containing protein 3, mitochondrial [Clarias gariepinus]|uniref:FAST kinase domain-containing protein 3, mitochondrial n=1 Tax=Clarias gariepinus TaxID=13013 RepID=UPI00234D7497|nr:FAST kinase domain-containing protein 3, mitochondrial [Clarias gariepinus]XP_053353080.1 FAST kinase domain-containing protein 3, mitochondrial [Clarias gariepinus]